MTPAELRARLRGLAPVLVRAGTGGEGLVLAAADALEAKDAEVEGLKARTIPVVDIGAEELAAERDSLRAEVERTQWHPVTTDTRTWPPEGVVFRAWIKLPHGRLYTDPGRAYEQVGCRDGEWFDDRMRMGVIVTHWQPAPAPPGEARAALEDR